MAKYWTRYICIALLALCTAGCADEEWMENHGKLGEGEAWIKVDFGHQDFKQIEISTRSTLDEVVESRVQDIYALIFVNGKCVYNHYFGNDADSKKSTKAEVVQAAANKGSECWWVQNRTSTSNSGSDSQTADTHGTLCMNTPTFEGGELYLIANANAYTVNISPEKLGTIRTKQDLEELTSVLNGDVLTRYGYFPMVAELKDVKVTSQGLTQNNASVVAELKRLDAKVRVNVMAATGATSKYGSDGNEIEVKVNRFTPVSWQVMNVPKGSFIVQNEGGEDDITGYFNSTVNTFEESTNSTYNGKATTNHSFSFYMLENRHASKGISDYHQREERKKDDTSGAYLYPIPNDEGDEKDIWKYAPENATYLILKGYLAMEPSDPANASSAYEIGADVTYYIHLGDFVSSANTDDKLNNFSIERNTHYTYNITIKGIRNIELEVTKKQENQAGATGTIYATQETIRQFDAHYEQFTTFIDVNKLNTQTMSWYVETPFGKIGSPKLNENIAQGSAGYAEALKGYDYKWVWFMVNPVVDDGVYDRRNQWYPGDQYRTGGSMGKTLGDEKHLMNVDEFVQYMKEQKVKFDTDNEHIFKENGVAVTVFIDEYYYEADPISGEAETGLWKRFVNQPCRMMHLLGDGLRSDDGESCITGGLITIRQSSIQTPYNINKPALNTAWGGEVVDEVSGVISWFYDEDNSHSPSTNPRGQTKLNTWHEPAERADNTSRDNGLYNTAQLMGLINGENFVVKKWITYLNYNQAATASKKDYLNTGYKGMLYAVLLRNRDNNGDGNLDASELKWYVASLGQIAGLYIGGLGLQDKSAMLYDQSLASLPAVTTGSYQPWRKHIVTSTKTSYSIDEGYGYLIGENHRPAVVWAEEGLSTSYYCQENENWGLSDTAPFSIRCVRNLGMNNSAETIVKEANQPENLIKTTRDGSVYYFDLTNVNEASLRLPSTTLELWPTHEFDFNSRTYRGFKTHSEFVSLNTRNLDNEYSNLSNYLKGISTTTNYQTIEGYRVPNVREGALMSIYCESDWWGTSYSQFQTLVSTKIYRSDVISGFNKVSWAFSNGFASLAGNANWNMGVRPVQDYDPN